MGTVERLSAHEVEIARQCLSAAVEGPFFPYCEFAALIGLDRGDPAAQELAVNNVLNDLLGYPHHQWKAWPQYITATPPTSQPSWCAGMATSISTLQRAATLTGCADPRPTSH